MKSLSLALHVKYVRFPLIELLLAHAVYPYAYAFQPVEALRHSRPSSLESISCNFGNVCSKLALKGIFIIAILYHFGIYFRRGRVAARKIFFLRPEI